MRERAALEVEIADLVGVGGERDQRAADAAGNHERGEDARRDEDGGDRQRLLEERNAGGGEVGERSGDDDAMAAEQVRGPTAEPMEDMRAR